MRSSDMEIVTLTSGEAGLSVAPAIGGGIVRFWTVNRGSEIDWLRPGNARALALRDPTALACFALVPYSNRIRDGRFTFMGRVIELPRGAMREANAEHGHGWDRAWTVSEHAADSLTVEYRHKADHWPFDYRARQSFRLDHGGLTVTMTLANEADAPMPCGLGLHPYFPRARGTLLRAQVDGMWLTDDDVLPRALVAPDASADPRLGLNVDERALDNVFSGWSGTAVIEWPDSGRALKLQMNAENRFLVVYSPPGEPYFCAEPVTNCTDAFNLAVQGRTDTGMIVLAPGEVVTAIIRFTPIART